MTEALIGVAIVAVTVGVPAITAFAVARFTQPSAEAQEEKLVAETQRIITDVNAAVQEQLRDQLADQAEIISKLESRVAALEASLETERMERKRLQGELEHECELRMELEVRLDRIHQWAKALEAQVIELGATPVPFSRFT